MSEILSEEELPAVCKELFIPQRDHGIDAHGAARRDIVSRECDSGEDDNHSSERDGIRRVDAVVSGGMSAARRPESSGSRRS